MHANFAGPLAYDCFVERAMSLLFGLADEDAEKFAIFGNRHIRFNIITPNDRATPQ